MKRRLTIRFLAGFVLVCVSLVHKTGSTNLEPIPILTNGSCGAGGVCSAVVRPEQNFELKAAGSVVARRGFPMTIVSLNSDKDKPSNYYRDINVTGIIIDYFIYAGLSYAALSLLVLTKRKNETLCST